jgi:hypothetical protein
MKNNTLIWVLVAVVLVGGAWYFYTASSSESTSSLPVATTTTTTTVTQAQAAPAKTPTETKKPTSTSAKVVGIGSMQFLIGLKQALVCSVKTTAGYTRTGTLYVADGKVRLNFSTTSMIDDGAHLFVWMMGAIKGLELQAASSASGSAIANNGGVDPASDLSYACNPWAVDASVFTPPATVSFFSSL